MAGAKVTSFEALREFHRACCTFVESATAALVEADMEIRRVLEWLGSEQAAYWERNLRNSRADVDQARSDLARQRMSPTAHCEEQREQLTLAQRNLRLAEEKVEQIRIWRRRVEQAVSEYRGPAEQLHHGLDGDPPPLVARLARILDRLEAYATPAGVPPAEIPMAPVSDKDGESS